MLLISHTYATIVKQFFPLGNSMNTMFDCVKFKIHFIKPLSFTIVIYYYYFLKKGPIPKHDQQLSQWTY